MACKCVERVNVGVNGCSLKILGFGSFEVFCV
jgi:hypothetical protein